MTDDELRAEVDAFLAEGGRGEFEDLEVPQLTCVARFSRPMPTLNASGIASRSLLHYVVENPFGRATATTLSIGAISDAISVSSSVRESAAHTA
jgi:hypothetical protein